MKELFNFFSPIKLNRSEFVKHSFILVSGSVIAQALSVILYPVFSRLYTPEQFGTFALFTSVSGILTILASGVYEQAILLTKKNNQAQALMVLSLLLTLLQCIIFYGCFSLFNHFIAHSILKNPSIEPFLIWLPFSVLLANLNSILIAYANRNKLFNYIAQNSISLGISINLSKLALGLIKLNNIGLIAGRILGQFLSVFYLIIQVTKWFSITLTDLSRAFQGIKDAAIKYKNFPLFRMPLSVLNVFSSSLPIFLITRFFTIHDAGQYSMATGVLLTPVMLLTGSLSKVLNQKIIESINLKIPVYQKITGLLKLIMPITAIFFLGFYFISEEVFVFILGKEWEEAGLMAGILLPWVFLVLFTSPLSFIADIFFKQKRMLIIDLIYLVLRILSMAVGIYYQSITLCIVLFVLVGVIVVTYNMVWYLSLLKQHERNILSA